MSDDRFHPLDSAPTRGVYELRQLARRHGVRQLAALVGVNSSSVDRWLAGTSTPRRKHLARLLELGVDGFDEPRAVAP